MRILFLGRVPLLVVVRILVRARASPPSLPMQPLGLVSSARAMLCPTLSPAWHALRMSVVITQWSAPPHVGLVIVRAQWATTPLVPEELLRG